MPELHEFTLANGAPSLDAFREQSALIACLYYGAPDQYRAIIGPESPTNLWPLFFVTPTPSEVRVALVLQGDRVFIQIGGTHARTQWAWHLTGAFAQQYEQYTTGVHTFHYQIFQFVLGKVAPLIPQPWTQWRFRLAGHSLGASAAHLLGLHLANLGHGERVEIIGIGEPRVIMDEYDGLHPKEHWRFTYHDDAVTWVPPPLSTRLTNAISSVSPVQAVQVINRSFRRVGQWDPRKWGDLRVWKHYGTRVEVSADGHAFMGSRDQDPIGNDVAVESVARSFTVHLVPSYLDRLDAAAVHYGQSDQARAAVAQARIAIATEPNRMADLNVSPAQYANLVLSNAWFNLTKPGPLTQENYLSTAGVDVRTAGIGLPPSLSNKGGFFGGSTMALWDVTLCINNDTYGRTQTFGLNGPATIEGAYNKALDLAFRRANLLGRGSNHPGTKLDYAAPDGLDSPVVEFIRIRDAQNPRVGQVFNVPRAIGEADPVLASVDNSADPLWNSLSITMYGLLGGVRKRSTLTIVGQPDRAVVGGYYVGNIEFGGEAPRQMNARLKGLLDFLCNGDWGITGQNPATPVVEIAAWSINPNGTLTASCNANHGYDEGARVTISRTGSKKVNGVWKIHADDASSFTLVGSQFTAAQLPEFGGRAVLHTNGAGVRQVAFYPYQFPPGGTWVAPFNLLVAKREPGRRISRVSFSR